MKKLIIILVMVLILLTPIETTNAEAETISFTQKAVSFMLIKPVIQDISERAELTYSQIDHKTKSGKPEFNKQLVVSKLKKISSREIRSMNNFTSDLLIETKERKTANNISRHDTRKTPQIFEATAYCSCVKCCGKSDGITKSGVKVHQGTLAVDPRVIPFGTKVYIEGMGWFVAEDTGNFSGKRIDIYMETHEEALQFGRRKVKVVY
ncbi:MAG: 3D domain-containing protein [Bacillota bacterium]